MLTGTRDGKRVKNQLHDIARRSTSTGTSELIQGQSLDRTRLQLIRAAVDLLIVNPVMTIFQALQKEGGKFRAILSGKLGNRFPELGEFRHARRLALFRTVHHEDFGQHENPFDPVSCYKV